MRVNNVLGDILVDIVAGKSFQTAEVLASPDELGVLKVSAVTWLDFQPNEAKAIVGSYTPSASHKVRMGDFLISRANTKDFVGAVVHVDKDYPFRLLSDKTLRLILDEARVCKRYLLYALRSPLARKHIEKFATGTSDSMRNISHGIIRTIPLYLPEIDEQRSIAETLEVKYREVEVAQSGLRSQLLDIISLRARTLRHIYELADSAPLKTLGEFAPTCSGSTPSRDNESYWYPAEIPWVKTGEVAFAPISSAEEAISKTALAECSLGLLPPRTVLIAMYGQGKTRGQSAILNIEATVNQACFAILPNETWDSEFLQYWLMLSYQALRGLSENRGGNQANLNGDLLNNVQIPAPNIDTQRLIAKTAKAAMLDIGEVESSCKAMLRDVEQLRIQLLNEAIGS